MTCSWLESSTAMTLLKVMCMWVPRTSKRDPRHVRWGGQSGARGDTRKGCLARPRRQPVRARGQAVVVSGNCAVRQAAICKEGRVVAEDVLVMRPMLSPRSTFSCFFPPGVVPDLLFRQRAHCAARCKPPAYSTSGVGLADSHAECPEQRMSLLRAVSVARSRSRGRHRGPIAAGCSYENGVLLWELTLK